MTTTDRPLTPPAEHSQGRDGTTAVRRYGGRAAVALLVCVLPLALQDYQLSLVNSALIAALGALALTLVMGFAGLVTAGNAALLALGAYGAAAGATGMGLPFAVVLAASLLVGGLVGLLAGLPALRVTGIYLAIATLALHFILIFIFNEYQTQAVGSAGFVLPIAAIGGLAIDTTLKWYVLLAAVLLLAWWIVLNLKHSKFGRAWMLIRDTPLAAASQGIPLASYKLTAFVISSALVSLSGTLLAYSQQTVYIESFTLELAIQYIAMVIIGGMGSPGGAIAGAAFVILLPTILSRLISLLPPEMPVVSFLQQNLGDVQLIIYGTLVVVFLIWRPDGIAGIARVLTSIPLPGRGKGGDR
ncbi:branched-chain amino acid ABC transporter permease [Actinomadura rugatobispora]|uniref:Branched-chain amino acid ABC transporter permease n=1 Tax=Actinomadura rugatobispora TaxID=1994 RepID=A0ABW1A657_9ACTN|nr:branched-chain amino acid ABC transporter permease [Actinomadura rugatobispora]